VRGKARGPVWTRSRKKGKNDLLLARLLIQIERPDNVIVMLRAVSRYNFNCDKPRRLRQRLSRPECSEGKGQRSPSRRDPEAMRSETGQRWSLCRWNKGRDTRRPLQVWGVGRAERRREGSPVLNRGNVTFSPPPPTPHTLSLPSVSSAITIARYAPLGRIRMRLA